MSTFVQFIVTSLLLSVTLKVKPHCPSLPLTAHFELTHKVPSFIHNLVYNHHHISINAFTAFLCSKNNLTVTYFHTQAIQIYVQEQHAKHGLYP